MWFLGEPFLKYLKERPLLNKIQDLLFTFTILTWAAIIYIGATNFKEIENIVGIWVEQDNIKLIIEMNSNLDLELHHIGDIAKSDRVVLLRFHNGRHDIQGVPFLYATATNETDKVGIENILPLRKEILISMITEWTQKFVENKCIIIKSAKTSNFYEYFKQSNTKSAILCPIFTINDVLVGFVSIEYIEAEMGDVNSLINLVQKEVTKIGTVLSLQHPKNNNNGL